MITSDEGLEVIDFWSMRGNIGSMHARSLIGAFAAMLWLAGHAQAACYADYKASRGNPPMLHYGVVQIDVNPCTMPDQVLHDVEERLKAAAGSVGVRR